MLNDVGRGDLPEESPFTIKVNGEALATLMCSRNKLTYLAVGFLFLQGVIDNISEINFIRICDEELCAEVNLTNDYDYNEFWKEKVISSGCTGGIASLSQDLKVIDKSIKTTIATAQVFSLLKNLYEQAVCHHATGGMHSSGISLDGRQIFAAAEDIGRHNTIDKLAGICLIKEIPSKGGILFTTGRISFEMVAKASRMETPILISRTAPTSLAVKMAEDLGITIVGYARGGKVETYTYPWRICT